MDELYDVQAKSFVLLSGAAGVSSSAIFCYTIFKGQFAMTTRPKDCSLDF